MKVIAGYPPNWEKIKEYFPGIEHAPILITYGDTIYNPDGGPIPDHLFAHEEVHMQQQLAFPGGPDAYMEKFAHDPKFRLEVEVEAYIQQLRFIRKQDRNRASRMVPILAQHLASHVYGHMVTYEDAYQRLLSYVV